MGPPGLVARRDPDVGTGVPRTQMDWEVHPDGLIDVVRLVSDRAPSLPVYITENGAAYPDEVTGDGTVDDEERRHFFELHLNAARRRSIRVCRCADISPGVCSTISNGRSATAAASASCTWTTRHSNASKRSGHWFRIGCKPPPDS